MVSTIRLASATAAAAGFAVVALFATGCPGPAGPGGAGTGSGSGPVEVVSIRGPDGVMVHRVNACESPEAARQREQAITDRNQAAFQRALSGQGLHAPRLTADYFVSHDGAIGWEVVEAAGARTLLAPSSRIKCGESNPWRLAQDPQGDVYSVIVSEHVVARHALAICGCPGDAAITCGGGASEPVRWRWQLPAGAEYKGPLSVVVDLEVSSTLYTGRDGQSCPESKTP